MITLDEYLTQFESRLDSQSEKMGLKDAIGDIADACVRIMDLVGRGPLVGVHGNAGKTNVQGENQQKLDILSNQILLDKLAWSGNWAGLASEELEHIYHIPQSAKKGKFLCAFDPLDGSGNIDINMPIGTIFSILPYDKPDAPHNSDFLRKGHEQIAAGYVLYGASTMLVMTLGDGVLGFTFDRNVGKFFLTHESIVMPDTAHYAINASNYHVWEAPVRQYVDECLLGKDGVRGRTYNMRWIGCMVGETHRLLLKGGMFMYPNDSRDPNKAGHLRLLYECNPMSLLIEQAGGRSIIGSSETLDLQPEDLHQRVPLMFGTKTEIDYLFDLHQQEMLKS